MYAVLIVIHIIASVFLIAVILLQAGRGGGLADSFGGSQMQNLFGTKSANVLTKLTTICAVVFILTCLSLALISSRRSRSLVDTMKLPVQATTVDVTTTTQEPVEEESVAPVALPAPEQTQGSTNEAE